MKNYQVGKELTLTACDIPCYFSDIVTVNASLLALVMLNTFMHYTHPQFLS